MTLLDTLPTAVSHPAPNLSAAIQLVAAVLDRSARGMQRLLNRYTPQQILAAAEVLFLVMLNDTGLQLAENPHMATYLRDAGTMNEVAFIRNTPAQEGEVCAAYRAFIDRVAVARCPLYRRPMEAEVTPSPSSQTIGVGYALAALAMARMAVTGEDCDELVERYLLANA